MNVSYCLSQARNSGLFPEFRVVVGVTTSNLHSEIIKQDQTLDELHKIITWSPIFVKSCISSPAYLFQYYGYCREVNIWKNEDFVNHELERERKKKSIKFLSLKLASATIFESCCQDSVQRKWTIWRIKPISNTSKLFSLLNFFNEYFMVSSILILFFQQKIIPYNEYHNGQQFPALLKSKGLWINPIIFLESNSKVTFSWTLFLWHWLV